MGSEQRIIQFSMTACFKKIQVFLIFFLLAKRYAVFILLAHDIRSFANSIVYVEVCSTHNDFARKKH